jgi:hypothetical protein
MKRALSHATIVAYLGMLFCGLVSHALDWGKSSHPAMYFIVWDMYCGWCAYESRLHVLGEGVSGTYYELTPPPWGDFHPHGSIGREHYDVQARFAHELGLTTLRYTTHEPMDRILVVEECWSKKYNLPDNLWARRFNEPKRRHSYCHLRVIANADGKIVRQTSPWVAFASQRCLMDNPRLLSDMTKGHSFLAVDPLQRHPAVVPASYEPGPGVQ